MAKHRGLNLGAVDKVSSDKGIGPEVRYVDDLIVVSNFIPGVTLEESDVHGGGRFGSGRSLCEMCGR